MEASKSIGLTQKEMYRCCNSKNKQLGEDKHGTFLKWMYYDDYLKSSEEDIKEILEGRYYASRKVVCIRTGEVFKNSVEAGKKYNIEDRNIRSCCYGKRNYCGKLNCGKILKWMFYEEYREITIR